MQFNAKRFVRRYLLIPTFALLSGAAATAYSHAELKESPAQIGSEWPKAELHQVANAALQYRSAEGHLPSTLADLKATRYLPKDFDLAGVMYFRDTEGRLRLSWRDDRDGAAAYCSLDSAVREKC